jgi:adenylate cyclase class IV
MPTRKQLNPDGKVGLILSAVERKTILVEVMCLDEEYEEVIRSTPTDSPIMLTLDQWEDLGGYIAAEANHAGDKKAQRKLDAIFSKIENLLSSHTDEEPSSELKIFRPQEE